ncbi:MAG: archaetidylserine decarboxylase [Gammaproteobacteria bacterium]
MERIYTPPGTWLGDYARVVLQFILPTHALSRIVHWATRREARWFKDLLIRRFMANFRIKLNEAVEPDPRAYRSFNAFFTRALKDGVRPLPAEPDAISSPVDGTCSQSGEIRKGRIFQAKGREFSIVELLGGVPSVAAPFFNGSFATLYLAPRDYHRIHIPLDGTLRRMTHVPGRLFAVNPPAVRRIDRVFARNERVLCIFDTDAGPMAVVMVGALFVGSIETVWAGEVTPPTARKITQWRYDGDDAPRFRRGDEIGRFNMGSTVILAFGPGKAGFDEMLRDQTRVQMGERIGVTNRPST